MAVGIKETKEAVVGLMAVAKLLAVRLKDGAQVGDAVAIVEKVKNDPEFAAVLAAAYENIKLIPEEVKDIDFKEGIELGMLGFEGVKDIVLELRK